MIGERDGLELQHLHPRNPHPGRHLDGLAHRRQVGQTGTILRRAALGLDAHVRQTAGHPDLIGAKAELVIQGRHGMPSRYQHGVGGRRKRRQHERHPNQRGEAGKLGHAISR